MRIREARERWMWFLVLWAALFGGIPLVMMVATVVADLEVEATGLAARSPLLFLALFPTIAGVVLWFGLRRWTRSGFAFTDEGIAGAHDAERDLLPWDEVSRIEWRHAGPTSNVRVNGRPLPSGPALFALLDDGRAMRLMQSCAATPDAQQRLVRQLDAAVAGGLVPVPLDDDVTAATAPGQGRPDETPVRTWSSSGRGEELPTARGDQLAEPRSFDLPPPTGPPLDGTPSDEDEPPPVWPSASG